MPGQCCFLSIVSNDLFYWVKVEIVELMTQTIGEIHRLEW